MSYKNYSQYSDYDKKEIIKKLYLEEKLSFSSIAQQLNTYANKIRRDAIKYKINIRDKSEAQANALATGIHKHPTKGTQRTETRQTANHKHTRQHTKTQTQTQTKRQTQTKTQTSTHKHTQAHKHAHKHTSES